MAGIKKARNLGLFANTRNTMLATSNTAVASYTHTKLNQLWVQGEGSLDSLQAQLLAGFSRERQLQ